MKRKTLISKISDCYKRSKTSNGFLKNIKNMGFKYIGGGASRETFGNGKIVIKIGDVYNNEKEFLVYEKMKEHPIYKYATVPIYKYCFNRNMIYDHDIENFNCGFESILICAQAKNIKIKNTFFITPKRNKKKGFEVQNKRYHNQAIILNDVFNDCHDENIKVFGKSLVIIDLNFEYPTISEHCSYEENAKKFEKCINFKLHKKLWEAQTKAIAKLKA